MVQFRRSKHFKRVLVITLVAINLSLISKPAFTSESKLSDCLLDASRKQLVSLGQPVAPERLAYKSKIRIGVLPFYFSDGAEKQLSDAEKYDYLDAAKLISKLSNQKVSVEIVFLKSFNIGKPVSSLKQAYLDRDIGWSTGDTTKSTWGFVRNTIAAADSITNFTNLDSVILEGNNTDRSFYIAEAMGFFRGSEGNVFENATNEFFKSIKTQDGYIDNAILLDVHKGVGTIAHEILHNYGLTDLYGSGTGPAWLSMMAGGSGNLLNYEKAVLGWFPNSQFKCKNLTDFLSENLMQNTFVIDNIKQDFIFLLRKSEDRAYFAEVINTDNKSLLVVYLLEQHLRPPIKVFYDPNASYAKVYDLSDSSSISAIYNTLDFDLLITNVNENTATLNFIPINLTNSSEAKSLYQQSMVNKAAAEKARTEAAEKARAEAAEKSRAETEAAVAVKPKAKISNKVTIVCVKGKLIKKVTSTNPKCPAGFKRK